MFFLGTLKVHSVSGNEAFLPRPPAEKIGTRCFLLARDFSAELPSSILGWRTLKAQIASLADFKVITETRGMKTAEETSIAMKAKEKTFLYCTIRDQM